MEILIRGLVRPNGQQKAVGEVLRNACVINLSHKGFVERDCICRNLLFYERLLKEKYVSWIEAKKVSQSTENVSFFKLKCQTFPSFSLSNVRI